MFRFFIMFVLIGGLFGCYVVLLYGYVFVLVYYGYGYVFVYYVLLVSVGIGGNFCIC